jgi:uncharacterized phage infection (PIP) family protein YhgE
MTSRFNSVSMLRSAGLLAALAGAIAIAPLSGCQSSKERAREATLSELGSFQQELNRMPGLIDETVQRLTTVTSGQNPRRASDFREFNKSVDALRERANLVAREANRAQANASTYFIEWTREANRASPADRPAIDAEAAARRTNHDIALSTLQNARRNFTSFVDNLTNIQTKLTESLSEESVMAVQPLVSRAINDSVNTRNLIDRLDDQINAALSRK